MMPPVPTAGQGGGQPTDPGPGLLFPLGALSEEARQDTVVQALLATLHNARDLWDARHVLSDGDLAFAAALAALAADSLAACTQEKAKDAQVGATASGAPITYALLKS